MNKCFFIPISYDSNLFELLLLTLTEKEKAYISKYRNFNNRYESLIARALIKKIAGASEISIGENGQPYIANSPFYISIAHCDGAVFVALSDKIIGIDLERTQILTDAVHFLHPEELNYSSDDFLTLWTIKEAFVKWLTTGFNLLDPTKIHCFKKENNWKISGHSCSVQIKKIGFFQTTIVTLNPSPIETVVLNELFLMPI